MVLRQFVRVSLRGLMMLTSALAVTSSSAMSLSVNAVRTDAEQYGTWHQKFKACERFFHFEEDFQLSQYDADFNEQIRQDLARQIGNPRLELNDSTQGNPQVQRYLTDLAGVIRSAENKAIDQTRPSEEQCDARLQSFYAYLRPYNDRIMVPVRAAQEAEERAAEQAAAPTRKALDEFESALGKNPDSDSTSPQARRPSDVALARKLLKANPVLRAALPGSGDVLCHAADYSDPEGLRFLLTEVWPVPPDGCSIKNAFYSAQYTRNYDNAEWLAGRADRKDLVDLAERLVSGDSSSAPSDYDSKALPVLERLFSMGLAGNAESDRISLLHLAIVNKNPTLAIALIRHGADVNRQPNNVESPPLIEAVSSGSTPLVEVIANAPGMHLNTENSDGKTALEEAIFEDKPEIVAALFKVGATLRPAMRDGRPPLADVCSAKMAKLLLAHGADPRWRDTEGNTLLPYLGLNAELKEVIPVLVNAGLPLNATNRYGATILNYATEESSTGAKSLALESLAEQREFLIGLGAHVGKQDRRFTFANERSGGVEVNKPYRIRLADGRLIDGTTDVFGKASWTPDGGKFEATIVRP
ncbi:ankyrin repeat domain-containing protein [Paraburkholderia sediminicola]|uniref:ankyrin repeat domain-containing protein n=1 Tax=Paraburkholderia sediminicola TaxID=458836 RepID=UPI0038B8DE00